MDKTDLMIAALDRYDVRFVETRRGNQAVHCPSEFHVHGDKNASAQVDLDKGLYLCHGCEMRGDGYNLVMFMEGVGFQEAKARLGSLSEVKQSDYLF